MVSTVCARLGVHIRISTYDYISYAYTVRMFVYLFPLCVCMCLHVCWFLSTAAVAGPLPLNMLQSIIKHV